MWAGSVAYCRSTMASLVENDDWERLFKAAKKKEMLWPLTWVLAPLVPLYNVPKNWRYTDVWLELELINTFCGELIFFLFNIRWYDSHCALKGWKSFAVMLYSFRIFLEFTLSLFCNYTSMLNFCHFILYPYSIVRELMYIILLLSWKATVSSTQKVLQSLWIVSQCYFLNYTEKTLNHFQCLNYGNICSADHVSYRNTDK